MLAFSPNVIANQYQNEFVEVSVQLQEGKETFKLVCQPKVPTGQLPQNWVSYCNDFGKKILELAVEDGMKIELVDKVFGMAGDFAQKESNDLPENIVLKKIISKEFGG